MASKCTKTKCVKSGKDNLQCIQCYQCENKFHIKYVGLRDEAFEVTRGFDSFKWFCDICLKKLCNVKTLSKIMLNSNSAKLDSLDRPDSKLSAEISTFKSDLKSSFATVGQEVKKNIECVNLEVKTVKKKLTESIDIKDRERNIIIFHLQEGEDDKIRVKNILLKLSDDIKDSHIKYVTRLGKKNESSTRPILIVLDSLMSKETVMKNAHKLKLMSVELSKVWISNDLTPEQRS
ncbi:hypothetical protein HELRODRAFT_175148 [Helobdella robusta]|uniref:Zinc finger PHD-type domain-containing protein n=1 Tax=Helobdella robusta TaxID=6412 RepID=T1F8X2_HELRO|nr:hypothetical protein HELRODRAFT_175148 [Helobdella robusta]ESO01117.1 hypothetical protein HELRODRAFT_175148 [Helobdella robusta]